MYDVHRSYREELKVKFDKWINIVASFDKLNNLQASPNNLGVLERLIDRVVHSGEDLHRKDEDDQIIIYHCGEHTDGEHDNMVSINIHRYISCCTDTMWRTIEGMNEIIRGD